MSTREAHEVVVASREELRTLIVTSLLEQGFELCGNRIVSVSGVSKERLRELHGTAVRHKIAQRRPTLARHEPELLNRIASGRDIVPKLISPLLIQVEPESQDELLFRYASLHWSIPVSSGYGRRLRFLILDEHNNKLIGILGLGDPVFQLRGRDAWVGWSPEMIAENLRCVMDAFVMGAVPPYSHLLCGKLVALLAASDEVRAAFQRKYSEGQSIIQGRQTKSQLAMISTTSALGRSSIYNRLKYRDRTIYYHSGYTLGSGEFHFSNGVYAAISEYARAHCAPTAKQYRWGKGFRNRREVIRKCLMDVGLSGDLLYHGVQREIFVVPLAENAREYLRGEESVLHSYSQTCADLSSWFRERWLIPRTERDQSYVTYDNSSFALWQ